MTCEPGDEGIHLELEALVLMLRSVPVSERA